MPTIAVLDGGITIAIYYNDHDPPHFHAMQAEHEILVAIARLSVIARRGRPSAAMESAVLSWATPRQADLALCWARAHSGQSPGKIA
jgi:hypothetical protein